ncbi:MAG: DivIVA domain-containing protein [Nocardioidaceae bacterium]
MTAGDLRAIRFSTAFRGYRMAEVDALLDRLTAELDPGSRGGESSRPGRDEA